MFTTVPFALALQGRRSAVAVRAQQDLDTETSPDVDKLVKDLQDKVRGGRDTLLELYERASTSSLELCIVLQWDKVENKTGVVLYGAGAVVLLWFSSTLVSALNAIPLVG